MRRCLSQRVRADREYAVALGAFVVQAGGAKVMTSLDIKLNQGVGNITFLLDRPVSGEDWLQRRPGVVGIRGGERQGGEGRTQTKFPPEFYKTNTIFP